jgi:hypothetical protein
MRQALVELGGREISPFALAPFFLLIAIAALWVPIRLSAPDAAWVTAKIVDKYERYADGVNSRICATPSC